MSETWWHYCPSWWGLVMYQKVMFFLHLFLLYFLNKWLSVCLYSMFPRSTHDTLAQKLYQTFNSHKRFSKPKLARTDFTICHYAGDVSDLNYLKSVCFKFFSWWQKCKLGLVTVFLFNFRLRIRLNSFWTRTKIMWLENINLSWTLQTVPLSHRCSQNCERNPPNHQSSHQ